MRQSARAVRGLLLVAVTLLGVGPLAAEPPPPASVVLTFDTSGSVGRSELDYTSPEARVQMLQHSQFRDVEAKIFTKHASAN